jgi:nucleotide-binding universal stress UspA family protein
MTFETLMVHLDLDHPNDARLKIVGDLAERFSAGVIGITACLDMPTAFADGYTAGLLIEQEHAETEKRMQEAEARFRAEMRNRAKYIEWRSAIAQPTAYVAAQSRAADLIILGTNRHREMLDPSRTVDPGELVNWVGRPVLLIPQEVERLEAKTILVAWKDTREARRAVWDALPFLQKCDKAIVVEIDESKDPTAARTRVNDVVEWLQRHNVEASGTVPPLVDAPAMQLDTIAWEEGADLIVAGAYGHSRFREWVLGGVTRDLIMRTPRCTLLAH